MCTLPEPRRLPGDLAMWFFILAELTVFALLILAFAIARLLAPHVFAEGRAQLDTSTGLAMTLSLLTAGLLAALALQQVRHGGSRRGAGLFVAALLVASLYVGIKLTEYSHLAGAGLGMEHSRFFTLYWILTGFHFLHVLLGMVILGWLAVACGRHGMTVSGVESGVLYWHMVDLVWVVLFPVVYVMG
ncbi:cytochrome-c oxidase [Pseudomonas fluorescens]|uniref:Cytochrome c oxidase subunit 3 n=1 Tax=Pseudomonas lactucae TaxID=2813360 RepID=A0A9X0YFZ6_9PSED|nr:cytochrome c oxidase subunit 3 [Pseudomonas lactucae]OPA89093.1 cytochrome-c oxidase [Pseudomonas fluorescens]MBN2978497.1 cytochrome c oxidase subunit 3 [Pseudomonas lactucae]MBN2985532.1 cytochrome c oxidase subunit 3 [Pseudomonas lactucae]OPB08660.1 cytochrome-c oxidase [Pseudomonas fluorescens]OPB19614.1 cytochrome-c oxidase [Pseudomonas fluorescens]